MSRITRVCTLLLTTTSRCRLYGEDHRLTQQSASELLAHLRYELRDEGAIQMAVSGDELVYRDERFHTSTGPVYGLLRRLTARGIGWVQLLPGITQQELMDFCVSLAESSDTGIRASSHIKIGTASYGEPVAQHHPEAMRVRNHQGQRNDPVSDEARRLVSLTRRVRESALVDTRNFKDVVLSLLSHMTHQGNVFMNLAEVRDHNLFTYLHTCNVATLSMGFGLALGFRGRAAFDLGTAALLHDLGKNQIPDEILDKPGRLTDEEWGVIRAHPAEGARMLLGQKGVNHLAVTVAFEHHMHFDGKGGYPKTDFSPSLASQLVAIADTFDALFGKRSYHAKYDILDALELLQADAGTVYNPELVDEFTHYITENVESFDWPTPPPEAEAAEL